MNNNIMLTVDGYKSSHFLQLPPNTEETFFYIESRGGVYDKTVMFGLQYAIKKYLKDPITQEQIDEAVNFYKEYGVAFNKEGWQYILDECGGYLPIEIKSVEEGSVVPVKNVLVTVRNTDKNTPWLCGFLETFLLRAVWYGTTVATQSWHIQQIIKECLEWSGDVDTLPFRLHDFGARGVSSHESAVIGGMAHMATGFRGSDTVEAIYNTSKYYPTTLPGNSINASEHSTITSWDDEFDAFGNMIDVFGEGVFACVSDSNDVFHAMDMWKEHENKLLEKGGTLVIRPDSGDPKEIICGISEVPYLDIPIMSIEDSHHNPRVKVFRTVEDHIYTVKEDGVLVPQRLAKYLGLVEYAYEFLFKGRKNLKGFKVLPNHIRFIQGDGVNQESISAILDGLEAKGFSADNISFGMGGKLLQGVDRDTQKFAMKCSAIKVDGVWKEVFKDPITDPGKGSKKGLISLFVDEEGFYVTRRIDERSRPVEWSDKPLHGCMKTVYFNGVQLNTLSFDDVKKNCEFYLYRI